MRALVVGTRGSALAQAQTSLVVAAFQVRFPDVQVQVRCIRTQGDRDRRSSLRDIGGQGVFVREIEAALLVGEIDLAVHSLKDMPNDSPTGLTVAAYLPREDPRDAIVSQGNLDLASLPSDAIVGTSSMRRRAQLIHVRPDLRIKDIRGNVNTRLSKLTSGQEYDAIVLALAGLRRLGLEDTAAEILSPDLMLPAPGQGAIAMQARSQDAELRQLLARLDHAETRAAVTAERAFLRAFGAGCRAPVGAHAELIDGHIWLQGMMGSMDPTDTGLGPLLRGRIDGPAERADALGTELAEQLTARRGQEEGGR